MDRCLANSSKSVSVVKIRIPWRTAEAQISRSVAVPQLIAEGQAIKQVAAELGIRVKTVGKHRQRLMPKLNIHNPADLTRHAIAAGIIESSVPLTIV